MQHTFLYKLYRYSPKAFAGCLLFLAFYAFFLCKNMDMMLFPHNSMFAGYVPNKKAYTCAVKVNGSIVPVTKKLWWKKDFLESNANVYGKYLENNQHTLLQDYIIAKVKDTSLRSSLLQQLTAGKVPPQQWAAFYLRFAGRNLKAGDEIQLVKYELSFAGNHPALVDSSVLFNFQQP